MNRISIFLLSLCFSYFSIGQSIQTPDQFLGFELGTGFTPHHQVIDYFEYLDAQSTNLTLFSYGKSYEHRPLIACAISSKENIANLEQIRLNNLRYAQMLEGKSTAKEIPIVWLSYNIHGDEAVSTEAALKTVYHLLTSPDAQKWLEDVVVILDPCLNPDGRARYVNWFNSTANQLENTDIQSAEHQPPWPGGRTNHYLFDLNRDWAWQTQIESQHRAKLYHQWMPQVHVDFHEMGIESPYFFAPAAKPFHEEITDWQRDFQVHVGDNNAHYFDQNGWLYYSNEIFDLFYPSYGDTWPIFQGSMGFTYEQGGSKNAGTAVLNALGDTLTLKERISHHFTTGLATIETAHKFKAQLISEFKNYFSDAVNKPRGPYKSYVIKRKDNPGNAKALIEVLQRQQINVQVATNRSTHKGFQYLQNKESGFELEAGDFILPSNQPQSRLLKVLMEPRSMLEDSVTYDLTAWALPYAYEVNAFACNDAISGKAYVDTATPVNNSDKLPSTIAYLVNWQDFESAKFLSAVLQEDIKVRRSLKPLDVNGQQFNRGSLLITRTNNKGIGHQLENILNKLAQDFHIELTPITPGNKPSVGLGSSNFELVSSPRVALIRGRGVDPYSFGELWYFFDQELKYPTSVIDVDRIGHSNLGIYDVILLAAGSYKSSETIDKIYTFVEQGGQVIAIESALKLFANEKQTSLNTKKSSPTLGKQQPGQQKYSDKERKQISGDLAGSIYRIQLDETHPLAFGNDKDIHIMKRNRTTYKLLEKGWNIGSFGKGSHVSGFVGYKLKPQIDNSLALGVEEIGDGTVVYMTDSPVFRGFWYSGKLLLANAVFLR